MTIDKEGKYFAFGAIAYLAGAQIQKMAWVQGQLSKSPNGFLTKNAGPIAAGVALALLSAVGGTEVIAKAV